MINTWWIYFYCWVLRKKTQQCVRAIITKIIVFSTETVIKTPLRQMHGVTALNHAHDSIVCQKRTSLINSRGCNSHSHQFQVWLRSDPVLITNLSTILNTNYFSSRTSAVCQFAKLTLLVFWTHNSPGLIRQFLSLGEPMQMYRHCLRLFFSVAFIATIVGTWANTRILYFHKVQWLSKLRLELVTNRQIVDTGLSVLCKRRHAVVCILTQFSL